MPREEMSLDDFLTHTGSGGGGSFGGFLGNWKEDGKIDLWVHPKGPPNWVWYHRWFFVGRDRETGEPRLRFVRFNSYEHERVLKDRFKRDRHGRLENPPEVCPFSKVLEWVWQAIAADELGVADVIFRIDVGDDVLEIHAGGFCGWLQQRDLDPDDKKEAKKAGILIKDVWKENCHARLGYIFRVIVDERPGDGCLIALESQALGDKMKKVIEDRQDDLGKDKGNPYKNPYAFRWKYDPRAQFAAKYDAKPITSLELTDEVREVMEQAPPSIDSLIELSNIAELRMSMEDFWCHRRVTPPWDELFGEAERRFKEQAKPRDEFNYGANRDDDEDDEGDDSDDSGDSLVKGGSGGSEKVLCDFCEKPMVDEPDATCEHCGSVYKDGNLVRVPCDRCGKMMDADSNECGECGARYGEDGKLIEEEPPKRRRVRRSK